MIDKSLARVGVEVIIDNANVLSRIIVLTLVVENRAYLFLLALVAFGTVGYLDQHYAFPLARSIFRNKPQYALDLATCLLLAFSVTIIVRSLV